jgi:hypothetical protein
MANETYVHGSVTVGTTATKVCTVPAENDDILVYSTSAVTYGGPGVTTTTGVIGPTSAAFRIPSVGGVVHDLYAVAAASATVTFMYPAV